MQAKRPFVFIGSSAEGLPIAKAVQKNLDHSAECQIWSQGVFGLTEGSLESLVNKLDDFDFSILVLTPDDLAISRGEQQPIPRDNVLLELGLFIGGLGRKRTFMVCERGTKLKLPSDLAGITPATYKAPESGTLQSALGAACSDIEEAIKKLGKRKGTEIKIVCAYYQNRENEKGLEFIITNNAPTPFPPHSIALCHPKRGSFSFFQSEEKDPLLTDQKKKHKCMLLKNDDASPIWQRIFGNSSDLAMNQSDLEDFEFRIILDRSDKVLYKNQLIGRTLAKVIFRTLTTKSMTDLSQEEQIAMSSY
jgi:hypothetical protein